MSRLTPIAAFVFLLFFFFFVSRSIISTRLLELKYQISREQLMNYELSSRVLREKFKQLIYRGKEDFKTEVKFSVLESSIMNAGNIKTEETSLSQVFGLHIINMVRRLSLKGRLDFLENEKNILLLQYAFYLERTKKYASANKRYSDLERILGNSAGEERAFIFLHNGFCLALTGKIPEAIEKLSYAEERFPGTSYSENAKILKKLILEAEEKKKIIFSGSKTPAEKAVALFDSGNYASAFDELAKVEFLSVKDSFLKARIYEETGQSPLAVPEYLRLISENKDPVISKKANRRLMLIGNFFEENREIAKLSRETAKTLGDTEAIAQVEKGAALVMKSQVKEEILRLEEKEPGKTGDNSLQELKKEIESEV
ncbi:MAG: hypothetical protein K8R21_06265, partial [Leptospira sp.]|nr:hypothetical protein [Leptospira sp.]